MAKVHRAIIAKQILSCLAVSFFPLELNGPVCLFDQVPHFFTFLYLN